MLLQCSGSNEERKKFDFGSMGWKVSSSVRSPYFQFNEILNTDFSSTSMPKENAVHSGITLFSMYYIFPYHPWWTNLSQTKEYLQCCFSIIILHLVSKCSWKITVLLSEACIHVWFWKKMEKSSLLKWECI